MPNFRNLATTASSTSLEVARNWLRHCLANHDCSEPLLSYESLDSPLGPNAEYLDRYQDEKIRYKERTVITTKSNTCSPRTTKLATSRRPRRLLDVDAFKSPCLDLRLVEDANSNYPYATLSHCWGKVTGAKSTTTISTLNERRKRISFSDMPLTFRHAVEITRNLKLRYLWIDALCIVQDSATDWKNEAARMADVYSGCCITISAGWSHNSEGGCYNSLLGSAKVDKQKLICIQNRLSDGRSSSLYFGRHYNPSLDYISETALSTRAWAFQERLVSPRILHYTKNQLFWECRRSFSAEDRIPRQNALLYPAYILQMRAWTDTKLRLHMWYNWAIGDTYSRAKLTLATDRLPAISALARLWSHELQSKYIAGMWLKGLWHALAWRHLEAKEGACRSTAYIAPSWSWASVNGHVQWLAFSVGLFTLPLVRIEETKVEIDGDDPFGRVLSGYIRVTGRIQKCDIRNPILENATTYLDFADEIVEFAHCLLLCSASPSVDMSYASGYILLLTAISQDQCEYKRIGVGKIRRLGSLFSDCPEHTITII